MPPIGMSEASCVTRRRPIPAPAPESLLHRLLRRDRSFPDLPFRSEAAENDRSLCGRLPLRGAADGVPPEHSSRPANISRISSAVSTCAASSVADIGTGSGILALAAARAGASARRRPRHQSERRVGGGRERPHQRPRRPRDRRCAPICCRRSPPGRCSTSSYPTRRTFPASRAISPTAPGTAAPSHRDIVELFDQARERLAPDGRMYVLFSTRSRPQLRCGTLMEQASMRSRLVERTLDHDRHLRDLRAARRVDQPDGTGRRLSDSAAGTDACRISKSATYRWSMTRRPGR